MIPPDALMPDDLIRSRTWETLTAAEKEQLKEVAATEADFRLLKLLLTSAPLHEDVPPLNPAIKVRLKEQFRAAQKDIPKTIGWWRYAVAAVLLAAIACTVWFTMQKNKKESAIATTTPKKEIIRYDTASTPVTNPVNEMKSAPKLTRVPIPVTVRKKTVLPQKKEPKKIMPSPVIPIPVETPNISVAVNTRLKGNSDLLQVITEVY
jgi:hypothetical protein